MSIFFRKKLFTNINIGKYIPLAVIASNKKKRSNPSSNVGSITQPKASAIYKKLINHRINTKYNKNPNTKLNKPAIKIYNVFIIYFNSLYTPSVCYNNCEISTKLLH